MRSDETKESTFFPYYFFEDRGCGDVHDRSGAASGSPVPACRWQEIDFSAQFNRGLSGIFSSSISSPNTSPEPGPFVGRACLPGLASACCFWRRSSTAGKRLLSGKERPPHLQASVSLPR